MADQLTNGSGISVVVWSRSPNLGSHINNGYKKTNYVLSHMSCAVVTDIAMLYRHW